HTMPAGRGHRLCTAVAGGLCRAVAPGGLCRAVAPRGLCRAVALRGLCRAVALRGLCRAVALRGLRWTPRRRLLTAHGHAATLQGGRLPAGSGRLRCPGPAGCPRTAGSDGLRQCPCPPVAPPACPTWAAACEAAWLAACTAAWFAACTAACVAAWTV